MKKLFRFASALAAVLGVLASCERVQEVDTAEGRQAEVDLTGAIAATISFTSDTKVTSDTEGVVVWAEGDQLLISMHGDEPVVYDMISGAGEKTAYFKTSAKAAEGDYINANFAFSPVTMSPEFDFDEEYVFFTFPSEQTRPAEENQLFCSEAFPIVASTATSYNTEFHFKNTCGVIAFPMTGEGDEVIKIVIRGNEEETICGPARVNYAGTPELELKGAEDDYEITLYTTDEEGNGVILDPEEEKLFAFVLPPVEFEEGFTIEVYTSDGYVFTQKTDKDIEVEPNDLVVMEPLYKEPKPEYPAYELTAEGKLNLVILNWNQDEITHEGEEPRNPADQVDVEKFILTYSEDGSEDVETVEYAADELCDTL